jgi:hypothetical protein
MVMQAGTFVMQVVAVLMIGMIGILVVYDGEIRTTGSAAGLRHLGKTF